MPVIVSAKLLRGLQTVPYGTGPAAARAKTRAEALEMISRENLLAASYSNTIVPLDAPPAETLYAGGEVFHAPWLLPETGTLTALALSAATAGPGLEARVSELFTARRPSLALALDALANELLFAIARHAQDALLAQVKKRGLTMAGELRPGDPGLSMETQAAILRLAGADSIGVTATAHHVLQPVKSVSALFGVGIGLPPVRWSRCDHCPSRRNCRIAAKAEMVTP